MYVKILLNIYVNLFKKNAFTWDNNLCRIIVKVNA